MTSVQSAASAGLSALPADYAERVYAGVLGKIIGVYLGQPVEGWSHDRIMRELGEVWYYVQPRLGRRLVATDDDITGTFTFVRAVEDAGDDPDVTAAQIGQTWLDYLIEERTILWWGGMGNSTEHTAYLRLKAGIPAPDSGSAALNGTVVAEQIGGQIFIDGWAMLHPGDPEAAADLARRAASVSHDGAAIHGAQVIAAMEALAFVESDIDRLLDAGLATIPADSIIRRLIDDVREQRAAQGDWRQARTWLDAEYGPRKYGGNVHIVPNHGLVVLALLYGAGDFQRSLMIVNTAGWDTDCNSGNLGCLLGIRNGLPGLDDGPDWRGPVADRLYLPTADGGRAITDAVREADALVAVARRMRGQPDVRPKDGARFHFSHPGSVQGFEPDADPDVTTVSVANAPDPTGSGSRGLAITWANLAPGRVARVLTPTFLPDAATDMGYELIASPTLYPGQVIRARVRADAPGHEATDVRFVLRQYDGSDRFVLVRGPVHPINSDELAEITWSVPDTGGQPIAGIGLEVVAGPLHGSLYLDRLTWSGPPTARFARPEGKGTMWRRAWVDAVDHWPDYFSDAFRIIQDSGTGLLSQGTAEWDDYEAASRMRLHMGRAGGLAVRVQGRGRWYGLLLDGTGRARLVKTQHTQDVLASADLGIDPTLPHDLRLAAVGDHLTAWIDGAVVFELDDPGTPLRGGAVALVVQEGRLESDAVEVRPTDH